MVNAQYGGGGVQEWYAQWAQMQQKYLEQWKTVNPWSVAESKPPQWWELFNPKSMDPATQLNDYLSSITHAFSRFDLNQTDSIEKSIQQWLSQYETTLNAWLKQLEMAQAWSVPKWDEYYQNLTQPWEQWMNQATDRPSPWSIPKLPALTQWQEQYDTFQSLSRHAFEYQQAMFLYKKALIKASLQATQEMYTEVKQLAKQDQVPSSLKAVYALWVDINEKTYAQLTGSDEYQVLYGDAVNAFMALKKQFDTEQEKLLQAMGIPTRTEINSIYRILQQQKRAIQNLQDNRQQERAPRASQSQSPGQSTASSEKPAKKSSRSKRSKQETLSDDIDHLRMIKGLGPTMFERIKTYGIKQLSQIATMNEKELKQLDHAIAAGGRVLQYNWNKQAKQIIKAMQTGKKS